MNAITSIRPSFYGSVPTVDEADDLFGAYIAFLAERNGELDGDDGFQHRETLMSELGSLQATYSGHVDNERFNRNYVRSTDRDLSPDELALLTFVKVNAGEAYGVEVTGAARAHLMLRPDPVYRVEKILLREEHYHTKMLVGVARHFEGIEVGGAWRPAWPLKLLIWSLAKFPPALFHPILLGSEISGVFTLNWMLHRLGTLFPHDPAVRESMERRLIEVLIDEVGHIAYNRIAVSPAGVRVARPLARMVSQSHDELTPELVALGYGAARAQLATFDYRDLPEEVRRRAWFV